MFSNRKYVHFDENFTFSNSASLTSQITDFCNTVRKFTDYCFIHSLQRRHSWAIRYLFVRNVCNLDNFDKWVFFKYIMNEFNSFLSKAYLNIYPVVFSAEWIGSDMDVPQLDPAVAGQHEHRKSARHRFHNCEDNRNLSSSHALSL